MTTRDTVDLDELFEALDAIDALRTDFTEEESK